MAISRRYDSYKDSGVEWIGDVPEHWCIKRLKETLRIPLSYGVSEIATDSDPAHPRYIRITDFSDDGKLRDETFKSLPPDIADNFLLQEGDILFARSGATVGKTFQFRQYLGKACFAGYLIRARPDESMLLSDFLYYYTKSTVYGDWKRKSVIKSTIENINAEKYGFHLFVPIPPITEQAIVVQYLDAKTAQIDRKIDLLTQKAAKYRQLKQSLINAAVTRGLDKSAPMKDSGVEWIGEMPAHWAIRRVKDELQSFDHKRDPLSGEVRQEMVDPQFDYYGASGVIDKVDDFIFDEPLILIGEDGANLLMRNSPLAFIARGKYWVNNHAHVLKPYRGDLRYFCFLLESLDYTTLVSGSAQPKLTAGELANIVLLVPPLSEQLAITNYLDDKAAQIDSIVNTINTQIDKLKELRKALINDVVTGKLRVT